MYFGSLGFVLVWVSVSVHCAVWVLECRVVRVCWVSGLEVLQIRVWWVRLLRSSG